jgi:putative nucleotidyltransferase with HDIG domain
VPLLTLGREPIGRLTAPGPSAPDTAAEATPAAAVTTRPRLLAERVFFGILIFIAALLAIYEAPRLHGDYALYALLVALNVLAQMRPISIYGDSTVSVGFVITTAIIVLYGIPGVVILAPLAMASHLIARGETGPLRIVRNTALFAVAQGAAAAAFGLIAEVNADTVGPEMAAGGAAAIMTSFGLTAAFVTVTVHLRTGQALAAVWQENAWLAPHYGAMGAVGVALAAAYVALGLAGVVAFLTPAFMMRFAMKQYVDKTAENVEKLKEQNAALEKANVEIRSVSEELRVSYDSTLEALVNALDARDQETKGHSIRVTRYMLDIARALGVRPGSRDWLDMQRGALLHDVGKIGVSDTILLKPGRLTDEEWEKMREHPLIGYNMLKEVRFLSGAAEIILAHHERWDGRGYPHGLRAEDIPLGARIFSVVDTFDSMTSDRPYRKALATEEALMEIVRNGGSQFDPRVVEAFLDIYETWVKERQRLHAATELKAAA